MSRQTIANTSLPFAELMKLEKINEVTFRSIARAASPGASHPTSTGRAYGGHVFAQAAWAAAQTVGKGFLLHNITGWFILGGMITIPFVYEVVIVRDGRSYCTRTVNVTQAEGKGMCFTCTCSFQKAETSTLDVEKPVNIYKEYESVLKEKTPESFQTAPNVDLPWYWKILEDGSHRNDEFPGLTLRKVDMGAYNRIREPIDRKQLLFYRPIGDLPRDEPNLHLCAHAYGSDYNSLHIVANQLGVGGKITQVGSLAHTVIFHAPFESLQFRTMEDASHGQGNWFAKEDYSNRASVGRILYHSSIQSPGGTHVATVLQDGVLRLGLPPAEEKTSKL